jgi:hypothetical protein
MTSEKKFKMPLLTHPILKGTPINLCYFRPLFTILVRLGKCGKKSIAMRRRELPYRSCAGANVDLLDKRNWLDAVGCTFPGKA